MDSPGLAVLGNPVAHSRSPEIHEDFARQVGLALVYEKILVPAGKFQQVARHFLAAGGLGFNVTLPCKGEAFQLVDRKSESAARSLSVNTVVAEADGMIFGDNTDGRGLVRDITHNLGWKIEGQRILVLGSGGAVRGILWDLLQACPQYLHLCNRTAATARDVARHMADTRVSAVQTAELEAGYDLVINGTSAGLSGEVPQVPSKIISKHSRCYDLVYGAEVTAFNQWCKTTRGCEVADGLGMLVEQAALSFQLWFSKRVQTRDLILALRMAA